MHVRAGRMMEVGRLPDETVSRAQAQPNPLKKSERGDNEIHSWPKCEQLIDLQNDEEPYK